MSVLLGGSSTELVLMGSMQWVGEECYVSSSEFGVRDHQNLSRLRGKRLVRVRVWSESLPDSCFHGHACGTRIRNFQKMIFLYLVIQIETTQMEFIGACVAQAKCHF